MKFISIRNPSVMHQIMLIAVLLSQADCPLSRAMIEDTNRIFTNRNAAGNFSRPFPMRCQRPLAAFGPLNSRGRTINIYLQNKAAL